MTWAEAEAQTSIQNAGPLSFLGAGHQRSAHIIRAYCAPFLSFSTLCSTNLYELSPELGREECKRIIASGMVLVVCSLALSWEVRANEEKTIRQQ